MSSAPPLQRTGAAARLRGPAPGAGRHRLGCVSSSSVHLRCGVGRQAWWLAVGCSSTSRRRSARVARGFSHTYTTTPSSALVSQPPSHPRLTPANPRDAHGASRRATHRAGARTPRAAVAAVAIVAARVPARGPGPSKCVTPPARPAPPLLGPTPARAEDGPAMPRAVPPSALSSSGMDARAGARRALVPIPPPPPPPPPPGPTPAPRRREMLATVADDIDARSEAARVERGESPPSP